MSVWSSDFVILKDSSFQESFNDRTISSSMDVGPSKKRRRTFIKMKTLKFTVILKPDILDKFEEFYYDNDVGVFDFVHPRSKKLLKCRFKTVPTATWSEPFYRINVELETLP